MIWNLVLLRLVYKFKAIVNELVREETWTDLFGIIWGKIDGRITKTAFNIFPCIVNKAIFVEDSFTRANKRSIGYPRNLIR